MATITIPNFNTEKVMVGLNAYVFTVPTGQGGIYTARMRIDNDSKSQLTASIAQAGSQTASSSVTLHPGNQQETPNTVVSLTMNLAAGDTVTYTVSSSTAIDQQLNTVKARLDLKQSLTN